MSRIIDQFVRKRCQKKRKDLSYQLLLEFFQKYFILHERSAAVKNAFSTYVWSKVDFMFLQGIVHVNIRVGGTIFLVDKLVITHL